jgi:hypothetical protein
MHGATIKIKKNKNKNKNKEKRGLHFPTVYSERKFV